VNIIAASAAAMLIAVVKKAVSDPHEIVLGTLQNPADLRQCTQFLAGQTLYNGMRFADFVYRAHYPVRTRPVSM